MLLLLLLLLEADAALVSKLTRLSPTTLRQLANDLGISSENLLASLGGRRPMPTGERLSKLQDALGVNKKSGNLDNGHVFLWKLKARNLPDFVAVSAQMFSRDKTVFRTDIIFSDFEDRVHFCIHSDDFLVVLIPCAGMDMSHLRLEICPPLKINKPLESFCALPADEAKALLRKGKATWKDAVDYLQSLNVPPELAMQWGTELQRSKTQIIKA